MKINRDSWHYTLMVGMGGSDFKAPKTVCAYFWTLVFSLASAVFITAVGAFMLSSVPLLLWSWLRNGSPVAGSVLAMILTIVAVVAMVALTSRAHDRFKYRKRKTIPASGIIGITYHTLAAWKTKVCPFIEYEN